MKVIKRVFLGFVAVIVILIIGFTIWANNPAQPASAALQALQSDAQVTVTQQNDFIIFEPADSQPAIGFAFYPGGRVDPRAYAPLARTLAEAGILAGLERLEALHVDLIVIARGGGSKSDLAWRQSLESLCKAFQHAGDIGVVHESIGVVHEPKRSSRGRAVIARPRKKR